MNIKKGIRKVALPLAAVATMAGCSVEKDNSNLELQAKVDSTQAAEIDSLRAQLQGNQEPDYGHIDFKDGKNGSLSGKINIGSDWKGDSYEITNFNTDETAVLTGNSFKDEGLEDGVEYDYSIKGLDSSTGKHTGSEISGSFTPFEDAYDYNFEIDAEDVRFDDRAKVEVTPSYDLDPKGNRVSLANFVLVDSQGDTLDTERVYDLDEARNGFTIGRGEYRGPVQVLGELRLERGNNVAALDSAEVLDDMPQFITGTAGQNKDLQGYLMQVTDFRDRAEADSLYGRLQDEPTLVGYDTLRVDFSGNDPDRLVGECWVTYDGKATNYKEAFSE